MSRPKRTAAVACIAAMANSSIDAGSSDDEYSDESPQQKRPCSSASKTRVEKKHAPRTKNRRKDRKRRGQVANSDKHPGGMNHDRLKLLADQLAALVIEANGEDKQCLLLLIELQCSAHRR